MRDYEPFLKIRDDMQNGQAARKSGRKAPDAYRTISEVADLLHVPQHVLRFWETRFDEVSPLKSGGGRRYYSPGQIELLQRISELLYVEGYTIKGVQRVLKTGGYAEATALPRPAPIKTSYVSAQGFAEDGAMPFDYNFAPKTQRGVAADGEELAAMTHFKTSDVPETRGEHGADESIQSIDALTSATETSAGPEVDASVKPEKNEKLRRQRDMLLRVLKDVRAELLNLRKNLPQ